MSNKQTNKQKPSKFEYSASRRSRSEDGGRDQITKHECNNNKNSESLLLTGKAKTETKPDLNYKHVKERKYKIHDTATRQCLI